jgi:hypothetical protein
MDRSACKYLLPLQDYRHYPRSAAAAARIGAELEIARQALDQAFAHWEAATRRMETAG